jgi:hypothetical protein
MSIKQSPNFNEKQFKNAIYKGEIIVNDNKEQRHGFGIMIYNSGRVYEGQWIHDK